MIISWPRLVALVSLACASIGVAACSDTVDSVDQHIDCNGVCNRYQDCFDKDYSVDDCKDRCNNYADDNDARQNKLDACDDCMDDSSCAAATFKCATECAGILP